jgi:hypothetical protein
MAVPGGEIRLNNFTIDMVILPLGSRNPTIVTVTNSAAAAIGAQTMQLTASTASTAIKAGSSLSFIAPTAPTGRQQAMLVNDATLGTPATAADVSELVAAIPANATAQYYPGLLPLLGIQDFGLQSQPTTEDTTDTRSGTGTEMGMIRTSRTLNVSCIERPGDACLYNIVKPLNLSNALFGREVWAIATYPDGEQLRGAAKVTNYQQPGNKDQFKKFSFDLTFMGGGFEWFKPVILA